MVFSKRYTDNIQNSTLLPIFNLKFCIEKILGASNHARIPTLSANLTTLGHCWTRGIQTRHVIPIIRARCVQPKSWLISFGTTGVSVAGINGLFFLWIISGVVTGFLRGFVGGILADINRKLEAIVSAAPSKLVIFTKRRKRDFVV